MENMLYWWKERLNLKKKKSILSKVTYRANIIPIKILQRFLWSMRADSDIFMEKQEYPRNSSIKKRKLGQPDLETNTEAIIPRIVLSWHREAKGRTEWEIPERPQNTWKLDVWQRWQCWSGRKVHTETKSIDKFLLIIH